MIQPNQSIQFRILIGTVVLALRLFFEVSPSLIVEKETKHLKEIS